MAAQKAILDGKSGSTKRGGGRAGRGAGRESTRAKDASQGP